MGLIADLNQLDVDADLVAAVLDAAFENILHIEDAADFSDGLSGNDFRRGRGDHPEVLGIELAERGADDVGEALGDVVGLGFAAEIGERENGDADFFLRGITGLKPAENAKDDGAKDSESEDSSNNALSYRWRRLDRIWRGTRSRKHDWRIDDINWESVPLNSCSRTKAASASGSSL